MCTTEYDKILQGNFQIGYSAIISPEHTTIQQAHLTEALCGGTHHFRSERKRHIEIAKH